MKVEKSCTKEQNGYRLFSIKFSGYGRNLSFFQELFEVAKKDFPELTPDVAKIVIYNGSGTVGHSGIEFYIQSTSTLDYTEYSDEYFGRYLKVC